MFWAISIFPNLRLGFNLFIFQMFSGWWLTYPCEKYESQLGWSFPIWKVIKTMFQTTNQLFMCDFKVDLPINSMVIFLFVIYKGSIHVLIHPHISNTFSMDETHNKTLPSPYFIQLRSPEMCRHCRSVFSPAQADPSSIRCTLSWICLRNHKKTTSGYD